MPLVPGRILRLSKKNNSYSENPKITMPEIAKKLNVTKRTIERAVKSLREENCLERKGGKRYGYWGVHE